MSDTPETDRESPPVPPFLVSADFARRIERERDEARQEAERFRDIVGRYHYKFFWEADSPTREKGGENDA